MLSNSNSDFAFSFRYRYVEGLLIIMSLYVDWTSCLMMTLIKRISGQYFTENIETFLFTSLMKFKRLHPIPMRDGWRNHKSFSVSSYLIF